MEIGCNIRLSELQALMIYSVVKEYKEIIKNKSKIAKSYIDACNSFKLKHINQNEDSNHGNYYKFTIISPDTKISDLLPKLKTTTSKQTKDLYSLQIYVFISSYDEESVFHKWNN